MASPLANGFRGSSGLSQYIPALYSKALERFYKSKTKNIELYEYQRENWTFHGKGIWIQTSVPEPTLITNIGSPNFGSRSVLRDLESQCFIVTKNTELMERFEQEQNAMFASSTRVSKDTFLEQSSDRQLPFYVSALDSLTRRFM